MRKEIIELRTDANDLSKQISEIQATIARERETSARLENIEILGKGPAIARPRPLAERLADIATLKSLLSGPNS